MSEKEMWNKIKSKFWRYREKRCRKCPMYYSGQSYDDWDCGCQLTDKDIDEFCIYSLLPKWVQKRKHKKVYEEECEYWSHYEPNE